MLQLSPTPSHCPPHPQLAPPSQNAGSWACTTLATIQAEDQKPCSWKTDGPGEGTTLATLLVPRKWASAPPYFLMVRLTCKVYAHTRVFNQSTHNCGRQPINTRHLKKSFWYQRQSRKPDKKDSEETEDNTGNKRERPQNSNVRLCRVRHAKRWAGWIASWNQDCQEKYQHPRICRWHTPMAESEEEPKSLLVKVKELKGWLKTQD